MSEYFPIPKYLRGRVIIELDLSNYATKADLKNAAGVHTSKFAKKQLIWLILIEKMQINQILIN